MSADITKYTKRTLTAALENIRNLGWIKSHRNTNNDGAIGNTLEDLLGISENNLPLGIEDVKKENGEYFYRYSDIVQLSARYKKQRDCQSIPLHNIYLLYFYFTLRILTLSSRKLQNLPTKHLRRY